MKKSKKKSIVIFAAYIPPHVGGIERYVTNLSNKLVSKGYLPIIVTTNYSKGLEFEIVNNIPIIRLPIIDLFKNRYPLPKKGKKKRKLIELLENYDIKAIIVNARFYLTSIIGVRYARKNNIPVYLIEHGSNYVTLDNKFIDFFANRYEDMLSFYLKRRVDGFYGVSNACSNWLKRFKINASGTWYNSIDFNKDLYKYFNKKNKEINFLYAGRIIKQKGVYNILVSFNNLSKKYKNINLYIAGDGPELEKYKKEFTNKKIHFLGKLDYEKLLKYYSMCDIFLYPPLWPEGLPTTILEAGMMKCSVIATDKGGIKEIITDNENGLIVDTNAYELESAMEKLILDSDLRKRFANKLYETIESKFSWDVTVNKILQDIGLE